MKLIYLSIVMLLALTDLSWGQAKRPRTLDEVASAANSSVDKTQLTVDIAEPTKTTATVT
jgi:hypothetical protein